MTTHQTLRAQPKQAKYNNKITEVDGKLFDSAREAERYQELKLLQHAGEIWDLDLQPEFELLPAFRDNTGKQHRRIAYRSDFSYVEKGKHVIEDVKGYPTKEFKLKEKLFRYKYPDLELRIVR